MSLFQLIRLVLAGLAALALFLLLRKKLKQRTAIILAVAVFAAADVLLCNTPLENAVYTFPTPKAAADYVGFGDVTDVVEGEESALFLTGGSGQYQLRVFPKAADGWKLCGENGTDIKGFFQRRGYGYPTGADEEFHGVLCGGHLYRRERGGDGLVRLCVPDAAGGRRRHVRQYLSGLCPRL